MAIDTENKRRNAMTIATPFLFLGLLPVSGIDTDDRENLSEVYIGFDYAPPVAATIFGGRSKIRQGIGIGF